MKNKIIIGSLVGIILISGTVSLWAIISNTPETANQPIDQETLQPIDTSPKATAKFSLDDFEKLDGSTVAIPLAKKIAEQTTGATAAEADEAILFHTTHNAILGLIDKDKDIVFTTYPSDEELQLAKNKGVTLEVTPILNDAFVFLVSTENPVNNLSSDQIRKVYSNSITNWKALGGADADIIPLQRQEGSGSQTGMISFMDTTKLAKPPVSIEYTYPDMARLVSEIADVSTGKNTIGYSYKYFVESMYVKDTVKLLSLDGVAPTDENIKNKIYPQVVSYYVITRKDDGSEFAKTLKEFVLSEEGQDLAEQVGYIGL
ncbi:MAG: substrate-binding domain-containing protein [Peptococcaceae bacterium]|nr:substrate-binding domain-containing protein [Peptococcaceae bacterium]